MTLPAPTLRFHAIRFRSRVLLLVCAAGMSACATPPWTASGSIQFETTSGGQPLPGVACMLANDSVRRSFTTPDTLVIPPHGDLTIVCEKDGYVRTEFLQHPAFPSGPGNTTLGIGIGGISGNVGLGVDLNFPLGRKNGGYPARITIDLQKISTP